MSKQEKAPEKTIFLNKEDDAVEHIKWILDQEAALSTFHEQVMRYIQPHLSELATKRRKWWQRLYASRKIDPEVSYRLEHLSSPFPMLVRVEKSEKTDKP